MGVGKNEGGVGESGCRFVRVPFVKVADVFCGVGKIVDWFPSSVFGGRFVSNPFD